MKDRKFVVENSWWLDENDEPKSKCLIYPYTKDCEEFIGQNCYGRHDGFEIDTYESLQEAIDKCGFKPIYIEFINLSKSEIKFKDKILKSWNEKYSEYRSN